MKTFAAMTTVLLFGLVVGGAQAGPWSLARQRREAERRGWPVKRGPDAPKKTDPATDFGPDADRAGLAVFVRDYNLPLYPDSRVGAHELAAAAVIEAAKGEIEPLSLGVHALADLTALTVSVGPLTGPEGAVLAAGGVKVGYLETAYIQTGEWVKAAKTGWNLKRACRLAPLRLRPMKALPLAKGTNRQIWITVAVPAEAKAGEYRGSITVTAAGRPAVRKPLTVRVRPYALIEPKGHFFGAFMTLWRGDPPTRKTFLDFKAHGIDAVLWFWNEHNWTVRRKGETIRQDFTKITGVIDNMVAVGMKGPVVVALANDSNGYYERKLCKLFGRPLRSAKEIGGKTAQVAALDDEVINRLYIEGVRQFAEHVKTKKHWPEVILAHYDEPTERLMPEATLRYRQIKQAAPSMRVYGVTMNRLKWAKQLVPISDILVCNGSFAAIRDLGKKSGKEVWGYGGAPARHGCGGARFNMGWRLWRYGLPGHWFWCYNFYVGDPWNEFVGRTGDANWVTVYPGRKRGEHIPTLAWEGIREARDDVRYAATLLKLLKGRTDATAKRIALEYRVWLGKLPKGRNRDVFETGNDDFYATLPNYHKLTTWRGRIVKWIDELRRMAEPLSFRDRRGSIAIVERFIRTMVEPCRGNYRCVPCVHE